MRLDAERWRWIGLVAATLVALLVVLVLWQVARAAIALDRASALAPVMADQIAQGQVGEARDTLRSLTESTETARTMTDGPAVAVASWLPFLGDDVDAVRVLAASLDQVVVDALPSVVAVTDDIQLDTFSPQDGRIDLEAVRRAAPVVTQAREVLDEAGASIDRIEPDRLFGRLRVPVATVQRTMSVTREAAAAADVAGALMPGMLGGEEPRRYLLLVQNNAEVRTLGGIPGSFAVITVKDGRLRMREQGSATDLGQRREPVVAMTDEERPLFPDTMVRDLRNTTITPDFPRAAAISRSLAEEALGTPFDGVVTVDPVTLAYLLRGIGPVTLRDGLQLTAENAVDELLNGTYRRHPVDVEAQDAVFTNAARVIFDAFVSGEGDTQAILTALVRAATDNRVMLWSTDEAEQREISRTGVAGVPPGGARAPRVGVFLNDASRSKMQYYLQSSSRLQSVECLDEGRQSMSLRLQLRSTAPNTLPASITGTNPDVERGDQRLTVRVWAPAGGSITSLVVDGDRQTLVGGVLDDRQMAITDVTIAPGESVAVQATITSGPDQRARPVLTTTPGIAPMPNDVRVTSACA